MSEKPEISPADLAGRVADLLDSASFDTTYKLATLEGLIEAVRSSFDPSSGPVGTVSASTISSHVLRRYWEQTANFVPAGSSATSHLRQRGGGRGGDLVSLVASVRSELGLTSRADSLEKASKVDSSVVKKLEKVAWERVVDMPIPLLQRYGSGKKTIEDRFLYDYAWSGAGKNQRVALARKDDTLSLKPGVGAGLLQFQPLISRLIESMWVRLVADWNPTLTDAGRLYEALFGSERMSNAALVKPLLELQGGQCFYCEVPLGNDREVDHFLPYSITRNERIENFVVACRPCNSQKSASLVAVEYLVKWRSRLKPEAPDYVALADIAEKLGRGHDPISTLGQAKSLYFFAAEGQPVWQSGDQFAAIDKAASCLALE